MLATLFGNNSSTPVSTLQPKNTYYYKGDAREMYPNNGDLIDPQKVPSTLDSMQSWQQANAKARMAANPRAGPYSQFEVPVVSSLDPHQMTENPLDTFQDNIYFTLTTFKNRNTNFDPRGQPPLPPDWQDDQSQLVQVRNLERIAYHGAQAQISGCMVPSKPKY